MASSVSPHQSSQSSYGGCGPASHDKSPLSSLNLNFLKNLTDKRTTRDGQPPKRRGPKPDSKPALTRRQELNRQAQRTHRERKELYIKALEDEVLRLKEIYTNVSQDKERLAEENRQLKVLLSQNGMAGVVAASGGAGGGVGAGDDSMSNPSIGYVSSASVSGSYVAAPSSNTSAYTPPPLSGTPGANTIATGVRSGSSSTGGLSPHLHGARGHNTHHHHSGQGGQQQQQQQQLSGSRNPSLDYDQAGIDFVLTLEKPCMDHLPWLLDRNSSGGAGSSEPCGHALMASCPPEPFPDLTPDIPFGYSHVRGAPVNSGGGDRGAGLQRTWELTKGDLTTLLDLSGRLNLDGEITPVMAWGMVLAHPRLGELTADDFEWLAEELGRKVRCYGFGAVMEEFEVRDALENILSTKPEFGMVY